VNISDRLTLLALFYRREARKCAKERAYLAACIMQASMLEALLHAMCFLYPDQVRKTAIYQRKKFRRKRHKSLDFTLYELINIADELAWFPPKLITWGMRATLAGFVHELRQFRNYVHPGVWAPERPETTKFTKDVYHVADEIVDVANSWLLHQVHESLRKSMRREGLLA